jgi:hypothetical protein
MDIWGRCAHIGNAMDTIDRDNITASEPVAKPGEEKKVLRAKPVKGEVDHGAITDKIIARFPNILKALAE